MDAYIYDSVITARGIGKNTGSLAQLSPVQLLTTLLNVLKKKTI